MNLVVPRLARLSVPRPSACVAVPAALALVAGLWDLGGPPVWRDEAATVSAVSRTPFQLAHLLSGVDAVHGVYYAFMHVVAVVFGTGEVALRLPSVLAGALAAAGVGALGRALGEPRAGLYGGALMAVTPVFSRYVQEARPYPMTMAATIGVTLLLLRAVREPSRRAFLLYGTALAALAFLNLFAFLVVGAHGVYVAWSRRSFAKWAAAAALATAAMAPFAWFASGQSAQIGWISAPDAGDAGMLAVQLFGDLGALTPAWAGVAPLVWGLAIFGVARGIRRTRQARHGAPTRAPLTELTRLTVPWLLIPPLVLMAVSWAGHPVYVFRYVVCSVPAAALLAGAALAALPRKAAVALLCVAFGLSIPGQIATRGADGRQDDPEPVAAVLASSARPGDGVVFIPGKVRKYELVYPDVFARLDDVALSRSPIRDGSFGGRHVGRRALARRLAGVATVWVVGHTGRTRNWQLDVLNGSYTPGARWTSRGLFVVRYERRAGDPPWSSSNGTGVG
ncbi:glycosyltransferase family 39 protein [Planotetraspora phitsanulokensis]|uniref:Mannosyltransferase n=1 Tax=Planotetraspora phitsanulokensis TaxID=575192 RepID=A0A8J3U9J2_9ACTN|nr:glycosyltransferase family 39 protein [Planotetraspora phitsanulokensis]GII40526.1 mannosyltransferase [Planotetraspora phitsanulokensis]